MISTPIKMIYNDATGKYEANVYDFTYDDEFNCFVTAWIIERDMWITAPLYQFIPPKSKKTKLNEVIT